MCNFIYNLHHSKLIDYVDINFTIQEIKTTNDRNNKFEFLSNIDLLYYQYSIILTEVRELKRSVMQAIFSENSKLFSEKSVLEKKLEANKEYSDVKQTEEYLFQFLEHIDKIKNNIVWLLKED